MFLNSGNATIDLDHSLLEESDEDVDFLCQWRELKIIEFVTQQASYKLFFWPVDNKLIILLSESNVSLIFYWIHTMPARGKHKRLDSKFMIYLRAFLSFCQEICLTMEISVTFKFVHLKVLLVLF